MSTPDLPIAPPSAAAYWSALTSYAPNWYSFCAPYINRRISGRHDVAPTPWAIRYAFDREGPDHVLEIGCLDGARMVRWVQGGLARRASGVDIAAGAIERGQALHGDVVDLKVMDLNTPDLPAQAYDMVFSNGVLHHITEIRAALLNIYASLKPGGVLVASEFTGPVRYAYSADEIDAINAGIARLPPPLRGVAFHPDQLAGKLRADPSESVSTRVIEPLLNEIFDRVETRYYGGNVLMRALGKPFFEGFDAGDPEHIAAVAELEAMDERLSAGPESHNTSFIAFKAPVRVGG